MITYPLPFVKNKLIKRMNALFNYFKFGITNAYVTNEN